jgi:hypothetical protein
MAKPGARPGTGSVRAGGKKRLQYSHLPPKWKAISDPASAGETPPTPTNAFAAESGRPTMFSVRTGRKNKQKGERDEQQAAAHENLLVRA